MCRAELPLYRRIRVFGFSGVLTAMKLSVKNFGQFEFWFALLKVVRKGPAHPHLRLPPTGLGARTKHQRAATG